MPCSPPPPANRANGALLRLRAPLTAPALQRYPSPMDVRSEQILLEQARNGDDAGFARLVECHSGRILNLAWRLVGNREEAEDIVQEAFLRLHRSLQSFRGESSLRTWLYRTVTRLAIDHLRREKLRRKLFFFRSAGDESADPVEMAADGSASPRDLVLAQESARRVKQVLKTLSPRQRAIFILRHHEELPLKEIADLLGLEPGTVKVHLHRAVKALRSELKDLLEEEP